MFSVLLSFSLQCSKDWQMNGRTLLQKSFTVKRCHECRQFATEGSYSIVYAGCYRLRLVLSQFSAVSRAFLNTSVPSFRIDEP